MGRWADPDQALPQGYGDAELHMTPASGSRRTRVKEGVTTLDILQVMKSKFPVERLGVHRKIINLKSVEGIREPPGVYTMPKGTERIRPSKKLLAS